MLPPLPHDVYLLVCEHLDPYDIVCAAPTCRELARAAQDEALWEMLLRRVVARAVAGVATPRSLEVGPETIVRVRDLACYRASAALKGRWDSGPAAPSGASLSAMPRRAAFFYVLPHVATAVVIVLASKAPRLCFISLAQRIYDTTDFVDDHPGGSHHMQRHHGADASPIFEAFPHSPYAHDLMRDSMLRFDAIAFVGRCGAPHLACDALPKTWTVTREAAEFLQDLSKALGPKGRARLWASTAALAAYAMYTGSHLISATSLIA